MKKEDIATIYCDESGNTGPDLMSTIDPFFVYAWVLMTKEQENSIHRRITDLLDKEKLSSPNELSSATLWQSSRGCTRYTKVLQIVYDAGAHIFVSYSEKVFEVCVLIIETYLDPQYNPQVTGDLLERELKTYLANVILNSIPRDVLTQFIVACKKDDVSSLKEIGSRLARLLILHPSSKVSNSGRIILGGIDNFYRYGQKTDDIPMNANLTSSHLTVFTPALFYIDSFLDSLQIKARLIRDHDFQFGELLGYAYRIAKDHLKNIVSQGEGDSSQYLGIQIADLAAGATSRVLRSIYNHRKLRNRHWTIWTNLRRSLIRGTWSYQLASDKCENGLKRTWSELDESAISNIWEDNTMKCYCGQRIFSGRMRDFYLHVIESHPAGEILGLPCKFCKELIPFGLSVCHQVKEHGISPPLRGDFFADVNTDYEVLKKIQAMKIRIVAPKNDNSNNPEM